MARRHSIVLASLAVHLALSHAGSAQIKAPDSTALRKALRLRLDVAQTSFANWAQGADNSLAYVSGLSFALSQDRPAATWQAKADLIFGQTRLGGKGLRNTQDKIDLYAQYTWKNKALSNPYASLSFLTQFAKGYDYRKTPPLLKSDFWDPAYLLESFGFGLLLTPRVQTKVGGAVKHTFTRNLHAYSDDPKTPDRIERVRVEPGLTTRTDVGIAVNSNLKFAHTLEAFSNLRGYRQIDVRLDNRLEAKVAKFVSANLNVFLLYDRDQTRKVQMRQFLGIGFMLDVF
ncbi:MAG: DUF3078 domain-containing protein [candidate division KSB1 bacterium]|nr:DUF3078 domain-containing protein [candidate division KSB1 bacterium]MDZ7295692.1 DUF3078 domain-containing protein [candidate division KSB1 bacterium]MDZ7393983.1 DUF3078 domain-containing protein [candidate division KSB1 bacterium]MDZ7413850.1 DUF3078 domain-containing protein [candidate division KSB1 bacterium]